ncbi:MAG: sugar kinase [Alphaproteobacteria bacterium]|jgi:2-dehydro-3-deoxygluconokinase|nr:sugar kinase [Alphaproteobacteria bacterium]
MSPEPLDIVCLGEPMVEFTRIGDPDGRPVYLQGFGGDTSNCAIAAARQGARVGYVTALGADRFGDMYMDLWRDEGIDTSGVARDPSAPTAAYFIQPVAEGRDFTYYRKGSAASRMTPETLPVELIERAKYLAVSAISQAISESALATVDRAIDIARAAGVKVAYDTNLRLNLWDLETARSAIHDTARRADILLPSLDEARVLSDVEDLDAVMDFYGAMGAEILALKCGEAGAVIEVGGERRGFVPPDVTVVDTSGAGDTFVGSFLARLSAGDDPFAAASYGVTAASLSTQGYGAIGPMPSAAQVYEALSE